MASAKHNRRKAKPVHERFDLPVIDLRRWLVAGISLVLFATGIYSLSVVLDRPFRVVTVEAGFQRVSTMQIEAAVQDSLSGGFVTVDLEVIRSALMALPWVDHAQVQRIWPNRIHVKVTEQIAAARWGATGLLNTRGELFIRDARHIPAELPRLRGPDGSETKVARRYLRLRGRLAEAGFSLKSVELDARGAWQLRLSNGPEVRLGRMAVDERIDRFIQVVSHVVHDQIEDIEYVDMRYSNGFALGWRQAGEADESMDEEGIANA